MNDLDEFNDYIKILHDNKIYYEIIDSACYLYLYDTIYTINIGSVKIDNFKKIVDMVKDKCKNNLKRKIIKDFLNKDTNYVTQFNNIKLDIIEDVLLEKDEYKLVMHPQAFYNFKETQEIFLK